VSVPQLEALGFTERMVRVRAARSDLHRVHRGIYAVGHARLTARGRWMAAVLACGPGAVLSHRAAAALHDLRTIPGGPVDVTAATRHALKGIRCHFATASLHPDDVTTVDAIPVTTLERTHLDLAEILNPQRLRTSLEQLQHRNLLKLNRFEALIARSHGRHGLKPLQHALSELTDEVPWTQSELERAFLELVRDAGLPMPEVNVMVEDELVDFYWPRSDVVVEVDGYRFHNSRRSFDADRRRDTRLQISGRTVIRVTHRRIAYERRALVVDLRELLRQGRLRRSRRL
jgi:very-short-patch-repair endonuclease